MQYKRLNGLALVAVCVGALFLTRAFVSSTNAGAACPTGNNANGDTVTCKDDQSGAMIYTGNDNDNVSLDNSSEATIETNDGNDTVSLANESSVAEIDAGKGDDSLSFDNSSGANDIYGNEGRDTIAFTNGSGANYVDGGDNDDMISLHGSGAGSIDGGDGADTITLDAYSNSQYVNGNDGNDLITVDDQSGVNTLDGGAGNDTIMTHGAHDIVAGGDGDDVVVVGDAAYVSQVIIGGADYDVLQFTFTVHSKAEKNAFQEQLDSMDAASGYVTFGGRTYEWIGFEKLENLLKIAAMQHAASPESSDEVTVTVIGNNRMNQQDAAAPVAVYCNGGAIEAWVIDPATGNGNLVLTTRESALPQTANGVAVALNGDQVTTTYGSYSYSFAANLCPG